jgi:beta-glucosidase
MAARRPWANPESTWRIYSALAVIADVERPVRVDDPRILVGHVRSGSSTTTLFINASPDSVAVTPIVALGTSLEHANQPLTLGPFAVESVTHDTVSEGTELDEVPSMIGREEGRDAPA